MFDFKMRQSGRVRGPCVAVAALIVILIGHPSLADEIGSEARRSPTSLDVYCQDWPSYCDRSSSKTDWERWIDEAEFSQDLIVGHQIALNPDDDTESGGSEDTEDFVVGLQVAQAAAEGDEGSAGESEDETGTDPRDFSSKFMPYYRYTELENNLYTNEAVLFGMYAFTPKVAMTYEWPVVKHIDYSDVGAFKMGQSIPPGQGGGVPPGGIPFNDLSSDGDNLGWGDLNLRLFGKVIDPWTLGTVSWPAERDITFTFIPTIETTLPTASDDTLGGETWVLSPAATFVIDTPTFGFFAAMNFYDFDVVKADSRQDISRYRGRWFLMQPLSKPGPGLTDGIYLLPELQPIYDFEQDHFSLWFGPEVGKIVTPGNILYLKPGFGIDPDETDRDLSFEVGYRHFF
jgi:hypothetical protein